MIRDPIEETEEFKAIVEEAERKVMLPLIEEEIKALENIVNNGFSYDKECAAFGEVNVGMIKAGILEAGPEEAAEKEERAKNLLVEIRELLDKDKIHEAYGYYAVLHFGSSRSYFRKKKRVLKEEYGIEWKTPEELNPWIMFD